MLGGRVETSVDAFALSSIGKVTDAEHVYKDFKDTLMRGIRSTASLAYMERYERIPSYFAEKDRVQLRDELLSAGFKIPHMDRHSIIVRWGNEE